MKLQQHQQKHIKTWQSSGMSQAAYCRKQGLNAKTFGNWLRIYRDDCADNQTATLVPVTIKPESSPMNSLKLRGSSCHVLEIPADVSPQWLVELLRCLN
ncbi:MAG: IS66 family insertion sequence element accessory protein TnpB [Burkholderiales bacterium]|nr:IS66 family insertion sequence element accessory protein TnpB [Nitrosomonas sp.]MCP5252410.1 IS66 family insertion sequence element accessory protein TnpB [Burkholderiales bacterium]